MDFFNKLGNTISAAGKDGFSKAKELKDTAKITVDIKEREGAIQRMYRELGKAYYHDHKDDQAPDYDQIFAIKAAFEEIGELKANKDEIRGIKRCPECGHIVSPEARFCSSCGTKCDIVEDVECEVVDDVDMEDVREAEVVTEEEEAEERTVEESSEAE